MQNLPWFEVINPKIKDIEVYCHKPRSNSEYTIVLEGVIPILLSCCKCYGKTVIVTTATITSNLELLGYADFTSEEFHHLAI